jgi:YidC/Oxa1 family membrane protein insertase
MDETKHNQRLLLAAALSFGVMLLWWAVFPPKPRPKAPPEQPAAVTASAAPSLGTALAGTSTGAATSSVAVAAPKAVPIETLEARGAVTSAKVMPYVARLSNVGAVITSFELTSFKERDASNQATEHPIDMAVATAEGEDTALDLGGIALDAATFTLPKRPVYEVVERGPERFRFRYVTAENVEIEREYVFRPDAFLVELAVTVRNRSASAQRHRLVLGSSLPIQPAMEKGSFGFIPPPDHLDALCYSDGRAQRHGYASLKDEHKNYDDGVKWVAIDRQYFVAGLVPRDADASTCHLRTEGGRALARLTSASVELKPGQERRHKFTAYVGVKEPKLLSMADAELESALDYTVLGLNLALVCQALLGVLGLIHGFTGSWGVAILGLTVLVKGVLFPLNQRSGRSMRAMSALKPEMDALKTRFPNDPQRQSEEMLKLYRKYGVNPAAGCLPLLLQMPIWFALYRSLWISVDLYQESFLWLPDLTARDPFWVLSVAIVLVMFIQQKMTPTTMDETQQKIMLWVMPLVFGSTMAALPSGLAFYILVNSLLTIVQQHFINKSVGPMEGSSSPRPAAAT